MNVRYLLPLVGAAVLAGACSGGGHDDAEPVQVAELTAGTVFTVADTTIEAMLNATGVARPIAQATLSTKLMGTITQVLVAEGDYVAAGQPLVRIDARDIAAMQSQAGAGIAEAEAVYLNAQRQAARIAGLYADSAATRAQLDDAEMGLARASAAVRQARAGAAELQAVSGYSVVRAPFAGMITQRLVDPGAFAAPGAPLVTIQDGRRLRVTVTASPDAVRQLRRGETLRATVEGQPALAVVEGVIPAPAGNVYSVNAIVTNAGGRFLPGSAATLALPQGMRRAVVIPVTALRREGDMTGVLVRGPNGDELRFIRLGEVDGDLVEVLGGLQAGDQVVVPAAARELSLATDAAGN